MRREAILAIGGVATNSSIEDYQSSLRLIRKGWKIIVPNSVQAFGVTPHTLDGVITQRSRWCEGSSQVLVSKDSPLVGKGLSLRQRITFLSGHYYYLTSLNRILYLILPVLLYSFSQGQLPVQASFETFFAFWIFPFVIQRIYISSRSEGFYSPRFSDQFGMLFVDRLPLAALKGLLPFKINFKVTPKVGVANKSRFSIFKDLPFLSFLFISMSFCLFFTLMEVFHGKPSWSVTSFYVFGSSWMIYYILLIGGTLKVYRNKSREGRLYRFSSNLPATLEFENQKIPVVIENLNQYGAQVHMNVKLTSEQLRDCVISFFCNADFVQIKSIAAWVRLDRAGLHFEEKDFSTHRKLLQFIYVYGLGLGINSKGIFAKEKRKKLVSNTAAALCLFALLFVSTNNLKAADKILASTVSSCYEILNGKKDAVAAQTCFLEVLKTTEDKTGAVEGVAWSLVAQDKFAEASKFTIMHLRSMSKEQRMLWRTKLLEIIRLDPYYKEFVLTQYDKLLQNESLKMDSRIDFIDYYLWDSSSWPLAEVHLKKLLELPRGDLALNERASIELMYGKIKLYSGHTAESLPYLQTAHQALRSEDSALLYAQALHWSKSSTEALSVLDKALTKKPSSKSLINFKQSIFESLNPQQRSSLGDRNSGATFIFEKMEEGERFNRQTLAGIYQKSTQSFKYNLAMFTDTFSGDFASNDSRKRNGLYSAAHKSFNDKLYGSACLGYSAVTEGKGKISGCVSLTYTKISKNNFSVQGSLSSKSLFDSNFGEENSPVVFNSEGSSGVTEKSLQNQVGIKEARINISFSTPKFFFYAGQAFGNIDLNSRSLIVAGVGATLLKGLSLELRYFNLSFLKSVDDYYSDKKLSGLGPDLTYKVDYKNKLALKTSLGYMKLSPSSTNSVNALMSLQYDFSKKLFLKMSWDSKRVTFYRRQLINLNLTWLL